MLRKLLDATTDAFNRNIGLTGSWWSFYKGLGERLSVDARTLNLMKL